ncbi:MAG TPA: FAD-dependent oxidoreductase [Candidatus Elarobacter sp.]|nr:FAD-dependent oxidoreductase [Candidatus Elarobacter sp.]
MRIAVVGGGINGVMSAWALRRRGQEVELFERGVLMGATSSASTKLLHGGLRYLEQGDVRLVREGLHERAWWMKQAPRLTRRVELFLPVYDGAPRGRFTLSVGLTLYDWLSGRATLGAHRWWSARTLPTCVSGLKTTGLRGAFSYFDAQMDDAALGRWAADRARDDGVVIHEHAEVTHVAPDGELRTTRDVRRFDAIANVAGPWARALLDASGVPSSTTLDLVRGSHLVVNRRIEAGFALNLPSDGRLVFALPYHDRTLVGTTEVRQTLDDAIECSAAERAYLIDAYNTFFTTPIRDADVETTFAGLRPLVDAGRSAHAQRRGERIETKGRIVSVFGGKWTTSRVLGEHVAVRVSALAPAS